MVIVKIPPNFFQEREYIIKVVFGEFLGLEYVIEKSDQRNYEIIIENNHRLSVKDCFFSKLNEEEDYFKQVNLPVKVNFTHNALLREKDIPLLFGNDEITITENEIMCGFDVFASIFFMLSRWEEHVNPMRDKHLRFPAKESLAYKNDFLQRPVVNEYVEFLWNALTILGISDKRKPTAFEIIPTHDIDAIHYPFSPTYLVGDLLHSKSIIKPLKRLSILLKKENPYDSFDWIMDISEKYNRVSRFNFMSNGGARLDNDYKMGDQLFNNIISRIKKRSHNVGFHPGYDTFNNPDEWKSQKAELEKAVGMNISEGRQHYLRFQNPETWQIWEENNMVADSTMCYADQPGFRCGTGNAFPVFDIVNRKILNLREKPLIVMETPLHSNKNPKDSLRKSYEVFGFFKECCRKYGMPYTILFHNSSFEPIRWQGWDELYNWVVS